ncbi:PRC and DUF2382 domain-containing protein [Kitasatospora sp. NPDC001539]|uniref:PRC and DUF2382 domain-containing protein n=1 Tax=Kitasatospora sp. NPDC001539 TaxID=3154384 RepID=UPI0033209CE7
MITEQQARSMLHHPVHDAEDSKIGKADHVFLSDATGKPEWVSIKTGWFGTSESFVPIRDARVVDDHIQVPYLKDKVKDAPLVTVEDGGHLSEREERRLCRHYGIAWDEAWRAANQPGEGGWAHAGRQTAAGTTAGTAAGAAAGRTAAGRTAAGRTGARRGEDDAMTRSEEQMRVGVERYESGHAKLHKYVVTEEQQQTVPVRHEEARIEREPITEANRDAALAGEPISEAEHEVTLHAERPVVHTEAVPVERVRLVTEEHVDEQTVSGQVRKERIEAELSAEDQQRLRGKGIRGEDRRR